MSVLPEQALYSKQAEVLCMLSLWKQKMCVCRQREASRAFHAAASKTLGLQP